MYRWPRCAAAVVVIVVVVVDPVVEGGIVPAADKAIHAHKLTHSSACPNSNEAPFPEKSMIGQWGGPVF